MSRKNMNVLQIILSICFFFWQKNTKILNELMNKIFCGGAKFQAIMASTFATIPQEPL